MAGHSKWKNIRHQKAKQDAKRGKIFTKMIREITVAARQSGDINSNSRLRLAVDSALGHNMPRDTIDRAIKRGAGGLEDANVEEIRYEGYGPAGVAVIVDCMSDNRNRTTGEVRHAFSKHGGNLGTDGSVAFLFKQRGIICFAPGSNEDAIMQVALEVGADDVATNDDGSIDVFTEFANFTVVKAAMDKAKLKYEQAEISFFPTLEVPIAAKETAETIENLVDALEELDDVQNVYINADMSVLG